MARELADVVGLRARDVTGDQPEIRQAAEQLRSFEYSIRDDSDFAASAEQRAEYRSCVDALADHLGKPTAVLVRQV